MIQICSSNGKVIRSIPNDDEFFNHLSAGEFLEDHPEFDESNIHWSFVIFPPERVPGLYFKMKKEFLTPPIKEAFQKELGLIEICRGDFANPIWVPVTPNLNIGSFKKGWYLDYCKKHGCTLAENEDVSPATIEGGDIR